MQASDFPRKTADNPHGDPLIALAEEAGAFTIPGYLDRIAATAQKALPDAVALTTTEPLADDIAIRLRAIEADATAAFRKLIADGPKQAKLVAALKLARKYVAKMAAEGVPTVVPPSNALRVIDHALAQAEPDAGHERLAVLPIAVFYGDLPDPDETPDAVVMRAQGNGRRVFIIGLTPEVVKAMADSTTTANPLDGIEEALKGASMIPPTCDHPETRQETHTYCTAPDGCGACLG